MFADPVMSVYFGMEAEEGASGPPAERYGEAIHEDDRERIEAAVHRAVVTGQPFIEIYRVRTLYRADRLIMADGRCFRDRDGNPNLYPGHIIDISDYLAIENSIKEIRDHLEVALLKAQKMRNSFLTYLITLAAREAAESGERDSNLTIRLN